MNTKQEQLINWDEVPEILSKEQFYKLCHISKSTALHLLRNGIVVSLYSHCTHTALYVCRRTIRQCWKELFEKLCRRVFGGGDHGAWLRDIRRLCG